MMTIGVIDVQTSKKPPCVECKRHRTIENWWDDKCHLCDSKRINMVTGEKIYNGCWWYRRSPFCKFESKDAH